MLIAQITDVHLGFEPDNPDEFNRRRLDQVIAKLGAMARRPDLMFVSGDLVDRGDAASYLRLRDALDDCPFPVMLCIGNHDERAGFCAAFPGVPTADGFVQYALDQGPLRFVVIDTVEEGRHGGAFCETRAAWLDATLAEAPDRPTVVILHHPPFDTGIDWMTTVPAEPWVQRLDAALAGHTQVVAMLAGHIHRPINTDWNGRRVAVCPSTAPQVALTLAPMDTAHPDNRPMIVADPPAYALHYWNGSALVSHIDDAGEHPVLARFDKRMTGLVDQLREERATD